MFCLIFLIVSSSAYSLSAPQSSKNDDIYEAWLKLVEPLESKCACESGAKIKDIRHLWATYEYKDIACLKCYVKCIYYELGFVDPEGHLIEENFLRDVLGSTPEAVETCIEETKDISDLCRKFYEFDECFTRETDPTLEQINEACRELVEPFVSKCVCTSGVKLSDAKALWNTFRYPSNNACLKCYVKCIYYELEFVDYEGSLIENNFMKDVLGATSAVVAACKNKTAAILDLCEKFYQFDKCFSEGVGN
ncbi:hypothetical protein FQR65_LT01908 [Abscondita terminalis]|nr:hypothetical protein FQR65_LT01908 [Abscondita terminalis]